MLFSHLQTLCDQRANVAMPVTLLQNTTSAVPSVGSAGQSLEWLQAALVSVVANYVDSPDELSSQLRQTTARLSEHNKYYTLNFVIFTVILYITPVC